MPTLNYTTTVPVTRTVGEIQSMLAKAGASAVAIRYDSGRAVGVSMVIRTPHGERGFTLPVDVDAVHRLLQRQAAGGLRAGGQISKAVLTSPQHAERVAWRVTKDWLEAQLAIIEAQMATLDQVMLPYLHVDGERTLYAAFKEREQLALPGRAEGARDA